MKETDVAWAAGFIDGEGYLMIRRVKSGEKYKYVVGLQISQLIRSPLDKFSSIFGGNVTRQASLGKYYYRYRIWSKQAHEVLIAVRPYLALKNREADLIIDRFIPLVGSVGHRIPEPKREAMALLYEEIRDIRREAKLNA